jgi:aryl-alcohol dehydrogenase-like predicted oxidoreductase
MTFGTQNSQADADPQLDFALDQSTNFIDTGELYSVPSMADSQGRSKTFTGSCPGCQPAGPFAMAFRLLALGFAASHSVVAGTIVGATSLDQLRGNPGACAGILAEEVLQGIQILHLRYSNPAT